VAAGVLFLILTPAASVALTGYGAVLDPVGDSLDASADLVFGSISITSAGEAIFRVRYAPGYDPAETMTSFALEVDNNPLTGQSWLGMGTDALVWIRGTGFQADGYYSRWDGSHWHEPALSGTVTATHLSDGAEVTVPLTALGSSDGLMYFNVAASIHLTDSSWTTVRDFMPDLDPQTWTVGVAEVSSIPVPASILLLGSGLASLAAIRRRILTALR
jgi:hypothetical protein